MRSLVAAGLAVLLLVQTACGAGWRQPPAMPTGSLAPRQQVQVWTHGHARQLHAVRVGTDSLSGVPFTRPIDCDSCRLRIARTAIDSVRFGNPTAGFWRSVGLVVGGSLVLMGALCAASHGCPTPD